MYLKRASVCRMAAIPALFAAVAVAAAVAPEVHDRAHFFKEETIRKLDSMARDIARNYDRDVVVETVPSVPVDQLARVKAMSPEDRTKFFNNWCADRAEATVTHGIYILICKDPSHLAVEFTDRAKPSFDKENRDKLIGPLLKAFREKKYDEGILAAMEFAKTRFPPNKK